LPVGCAHRDQLRRQWVVFVRTKDPPALPSVGTSCCHASCKQMRGLASGISRCCAVRGWGSCSRCAPPATSMRAGLAALAYAPAELVPSGLRAGSLDDVLDSPPPAAETLAELRPQCPGGGGKNKGEGLRSTRCSRGAGKKAPVPGAGAPRNGCSVELVADVRWETAVGFRM
jgi:hypothetical protein